LELFENVTEVRSLRQSVVILNSVSERTEKFTKNHYFGGSRSFKVINVGTPGKLVGSACYDMQQVCIYLQSFSC